MKRPAFLLAALLLAACTTTSTVHANSAMDTPSPSPSSSFPASWPMPDRTRTPGAIATEDITRLCPHVDPALEAARPTSAEKAKVYQAYGLSYPQPSGTYEADHLVPIELGGAPDDPRNLWPQRNDTPDPATVQRLGLSPGFVHNSKDVVEDVLHRLVCEHQVALSVAQQSMASDWRQAYAIYVGQP